MKKIDITDAPLLTSLLEIETDIKGTYIDIHNDYDLCSISYSAFSKSMVLNLSSQTENTIQIVFEDVELIDINILINDPTIDNFYRGKFEKNECLYEEFQGKKCFYVDFDEESKIQLLCGKSYICYHIS